MDEPRTQPLPPVKILVVDDHPNTATMLARGIAQLGSRVEVSSATSGHQALRQMDKGAIDILITDMIMPDMTGLELIEKLQSHPAGRPTFTYLITAYDVPGLKVTARRLKVKDVIIKPVHPERVCQIVTQAMEEMDHARPVVVNESTHAQPFLILIADDQPDNLMLLSRYLEKEGYSYIKAKDGMETLEMTRNFMPDLVLLDINMPHKDGFAVLEEIRDDPATEHIPVIILTAAKLDPAQIQAGLNMGADDYVLKPFDRRELLARIRTKLRVKLAEDVIRRRNRELNLLPEIGKELSARLNIEELSELVLRRTVETLGAMVGHLILLNGKEPLHKEHHISPLPAEDIQLPPLNKLLEDIEETHESILIRNTLEDIRWQSAPDAPARSVVIVPIFGRLNLIGLLVLVHEQAGYFKMEHQLLVQAITSQAAIAVENARLYTNMAQEQQKLTAILQSAADPIFMFDADESVSMLNPAANELFTDYEAKIGLPLARGRGFDELLGALETAHSSSSALSKEILWPDGRIFNALITPVADGSCVVVLHDVTHFKKLEKVKNEFIATASHDLQNPITTIKGYSVLMQQAGMLNERQVDFAQRIQRAAEHMMELVENMLDLAKMDLNAASNHEELEIASLIRAVAAEYQPQAEARRQLLLLGETVSGAKVQGDALRLRQAFRNLIGNAIKYTPAGGTIAISMEQAAGSIKVSIKDTGYGIPAADLAHIFKRFYRVHNNGHDEIEGNGLGLAIVKSIIEQHQGRIDVQSEPGQGTCFTVSFPCCFRQQRQSANVEQEQETV